MICDHEWYQGRCIHCEVKPDQAKTISELAARVRNLLAEVERIKAERDVQCAAAAEFAAVQYNGVCDKCEGTGLARSPACKSCGHPLDDDSIEAGEHSLCSDPEADL